MELLERFLKYIKIPTTSDSKSQMTPSTTVQRNLAKVLVEELNAKYNNCIHLEITDTYYNMIHVIKDNFHLIENAYQAITKLNIPVITEPIRGGTDGASLSFMGLPCPNLGTGGHNYHSVYEHISLEDMQDASNILIGIIKEYAKDKKQLRKK